MNRWIKISIIAVLLLVFGWFFLGIYQDREFGDRYIFIKHRPTIKFFFSAPVGESDRTLAELTPDQRYQELMYKQYVEEGGGYRRSIPIPGF